MTRKRTKSSDSPALAPAPSRPSGERDAGLEYKKLTKLGFISLEEIDAEECEVVLADVSKSTGKAMGGKRKRTRLASSSTSLTATSPCPPNTISLPAWEFYGLHSSLKCALAECAFTEPTPVQAQVLSHLLSSKTGNEGRKRNILGSAPTGSGKTLAFLLPILQAHLAHTGDEIGTKEEQLSSSNAATTAEGGRTNSSMLDRQHSLLALIIVPTRELALQITEQLNTVSKYVPNIQAVTLVGGLSQEKQERLLGYQPNVLIGTPGRLGEILSDNQALRQSLSRLPFLVLDEADRLTEPGHFRDMDAIVELLRPSNGHRSTFLFSATLLQQQMAGKKDHLRRLRNDLGLHDRNTVTISVSAAEALGVFPAVEVMGTEREETAGGEKELQKSKKETKKAAGPSSPMVATPSTLQHYQQRCLAEEKTQCLFALWRLQASRTLVFVNSIELVKDLVAILQLLEVPAHGLHAQMQQRQRLKNLDRFRSGPASLLITSDVAARGLDIPFVERIVHYHIPPSVDTFIHRSGRTARANRTGTSIAFVSPVEVKKFNQICGQTKLSMHELNLSLAEMERCNTPVLLAQKIHRLEAQEQRANRQQSWEQRTAEALGVVLDDDRRGAERKGRGKTAAPNTIDDDGSSEHLRKQRIAQVHSLKVQLKSMLVRR